MKNYFKYLSILFLTNTHVFAQEEKLVLQVQKVIIDGNQSDLESNRNFVASKLIISKKTINESGLQNVSDILRREPAITLGKDGRIGLMGLPGYTQILIDGMPPSGKNALDLDLIHVEKIEIIKSATASTGPFGIAGTINIISRKIERTRSSQLKLGSTSTGGQHGANLAWSSNQVIADSPFSYQFSFSAEHRLTPNEQSYQQLQILQNTPSQQTLFGNKNARKSFDIASLNSEFSWKINPSHKLHFTPNIGQITESTHSQEQRQWRDDRQLHIQNKNKNPMSAIAIPIEWKWLSEDDSELKIKASMGQIRLNLNNLQTENQITPNQQLRNQTMHSEINDQSLNIDFKTDLEGGHEVSMGAKFSRNDSTTQYSNLINGVADSSASILGDDNSIQQNSQRIFIEDDWRLKKGLALNFGVSAEQQNYKLNETSSHKLANFRMWSPSLHLAQKFADNNKKQLRVSLARTFQTPYREQMILHPYINTFAACESNKLCGSNNPDTADSSGNPNLQPERAVGLNLSYTHGLGESSELALEIYTRAIDRKIGSELFLENVAWSSTQRYVIRPSNLGNAKIRGLNLSMRFSANDLWKAAPKLDVSGNIGFAHSELSSLPGPDNRLAGQTPWQAKLGIGYTSKDYPLKVNLDADWLPADWVRDNLSQRSYQSHKFNLNANTNWNINSDLSVSLIFTNLAAKNSQRIEEYQTTKAMLQQHTNNSSYRRIALRLNIKL